MYMLCPVTLWLSWQLSKDFDEAQLELQKCVAWRSNSFELSEPPDYLLFFKERSRKCQTSQQSTSAKALPMDSNWFTKLSLQASMAAFARVVYWEAERSEKLHGPPQNRRIPWLWVQPGWSTSHWFRVLQEAKWKWRKHGFCPEGLISSWDNIPFKLRRRYARWITSWAVTGQSSRKMHGFWFSRLTAGRGAKIEQTGIVWKFVQWGEQCHTMPILHLNFISQVAKLEVLDSTCRQLTVPSPSFTSNWMQDSPMYQHWHDCSQAEHGSRGGVTHSKHFT